MTPPVWELVAGSAAIVATLAIIGEGLFRLVRRVGTAAGVRSVTLLAIRDAIRVIWILLAVLGVAYYTNLASALAVLVVSTAGALTVSLALQATLSNMISGLLLLRDGTLRLGDTVEFSGVKGQVVRITLRASWIRTDGGALAVVGNTQLLNGPLVNHTATDRLTSQYRL